MNKAPVNNAMPQAHQKNTEKLLSSAPSFTKSGFAVLFCNHNKQIYSKQYKKIVLFKIKSKNKQNRKWNTYNFSARYKCANNNAKRNHYHRHVFG